VLSSICALNGFDLLGAARLYNLPSLPHLLKQTRWEHALPSPIVVTHDVIPKLRLPLLRNCEKMETYLC
jgi:hypothetical protein